MLNFRQGHKNWKIQLYENGAVMRDSYGNPIEYEFPLCNEGGTIENYPPVMIVNETISGKRIPILRGWQPEYTFYYDRFTAPLVLDNLKPILETYQQDRKKNYNNLELMLFPRLDTFNKISVFPSPETISIGIMKGGSRAQGNRGVVLKFIAIDMVKSFPIINPNVKSYGYKK